MLTQSHRALFMLLLASCATRAPVEEGSPARGALVARVGTAEIHEDDLQRAITRDPGASARRFDDPKARQELIDGLVRFELLAQAAERAGLTKDPDAIHALQQIAVTKLVNHTLGAAGSPESISQSDVEQAYLARQKSEFTLPAAAQVRHISISDPKLAEQIAARARALARSDDRAFAALATSHSEDEQTRADGGDLGFIDEHSRLPRALVEAALALDQPGDIAGPIATDTGYEILRLVGRRAGAVSPLSSVQGLIRQRLYQERRAQALESYIAKLRAETPVVLGAVAPGGATH